MIPYCCLSDLFDRHQIDCVSNFWQKDLKGIEWESFSSSPWRFIGWEEGFVGFWKCNHVNWIRKKQRKRSWMEKSYQVRKQTIQKPVGVGGAMMSVQIFRVISCNGANSYSLCCSVNDREFDTIIASKSAIVTWEMVHILINVTHILDHGRIYTFSLMRSNSVTK